MAVLIKSCFALLCALLISSGKGEVCGGLLVSNAGEFDLPDLDTANGDTACVWIIQLLTHQTINFTLSHLNSSSAIVSLFPEHEVTEAVLTPTRLSSSDVGVSREFSGQTLVVILTRSDVSSGVSFRWSSSAGAAAGSSISAANYVDAENGRELLSEFEEHERLTWALNLNSAQSLSLKAATEFEKCQLANPCLCSYFALYELTDGGDLSEVLRVCGRSTSLETDDLTSKLVAFVYINSTHAVAGTDNVELSWTASERDPEVTTLPPTETTTPAATCFETKTSTEAAVVHLGCGGLITLPPQGSSILLDFTSNKSRVDGERCLWTLDPNQNHVSIWVDINLKVLCNDFGTDEDARLTFIEWTTAIGTEVLTHSINPGTDYSFPTKQEDSLIAGFLSLNSNPRSSSLSRFVVQIDVTRSFITWYSGTNAAFTTPVGSAIYNLPIAYDLSTIVINPHPIVNRALTVTVDSSSTDHTPCETYDSVGIFEIGPLGALREIDRLCGRGSSGNYTTEYPLIATFYWYHVSVGAGVQLSWN